MRLSGLVPILLLAYPIVEIVVFIQVGGAIGVLPTVALILAGVLLGALLIRLSGLRLLAGLRAEMAAGRRPERELVAGAMTAVAGLLIILPGFVSDFVGLLLLLPPLQRLAADRLVAGVTIVGGGLDARPRPRDGVVDLDPDDFERRPDPDSPWRGDGDPPAIDRR